MFPVLVRYVDGQRKIIFRDTSRSAARLAEFYGTFQHVLYALDTGEQGTMTFVSSRDYRWVLLAREKLRL